MKKGLSCLLGAVFTTWIVTAVNAEPVPLSAYTNANGFIDVQAFTCAQLANTYQEDADLLAAWYSGWYNGLAKKHYAHITRVKSGEHKVIVYCKVHPKAKVIEAIDIVLKSEK